MLWPVPDAAVVLDAILFAAEQHRDQRRQDASALPFVSHPIETIAILAHVGGIRDTAILVGAVLHDILEDTATSPREVEARYGEAVRRLVEEMTDKPGLPTDERRRRQVARTARSSPGAKQIRLADKIANLRSLPVQWSRSDGEQYIAFAEQVAAAARGINPPLDALFIETSQRARTALRRVGAGLVAPALPTPAAQTGGVEVADAAQPELRLLQRLHSKAEETLDKILMGRAGAAGSTAAFTPRPVVHGNPHKPRRRRPRRFADPVLKKHAEPGVGSVKVRPIDARYAAVSIDGAPEFPLPVGLANLLEVIAFADGDSTDGFTPFQSRREVAARLEKLTGRPKADHTVVVNIGRLRWWLQEVGKVIAQLVETDGEQVRLRLRRKS